MSLGPESKGIAKIGILVATALLIAKPSMPGGLPIGHAQYRGTKWVQFDTDPCGQVDQVLNRHNVLKRVEAPEPGDGDDEDEWVNAWNMPPEESQVINDWLLQHPGSATLT